MRYLIAVDISEGVGDHFVRDFGPYYYPEVLQHIKKWDRIGLSYWVDPIHDTPSAQTIWDEAMELMDIWNDEDDSVIVNAIEEIRWWHNSGLAEFYDDNTGLDTNGDKGISGIDFGKSSRDRVDGVTD